MQTRREDDEDTLQTSPEFRGQIILNYAILYLPMDAKSKADAMQIVNGSCICSAKRTISYDVCSSAVGHRCICGEKEAAWALYLHYNADHKLNLCRSKGDHECTCELGREPCLSKGQHKCSCHSLGARTCIAGAHYCSCMHDPMACKSEAHVCACVAEWYDGWRRPCRVHEHECTCQYRGVSCRSCASQVS